MDTKDDEASRHPSSAALTPLEEYERDRAASRRVLLALGGVGIVAIAVLFLWVLLRPRAEPHASSGAARHGIND